MKTSSVSGQPSPSTKPTRSWDAGVDQLSDSDSCSDVWVPRTPSAAEAVSGIWIACGRESTERPARRGACNFRADWDSPDPVFRRRVARLRCQYPLKWRRADAPSEFAGRSSKTVNCAQLTTRERRQAWRVAAVSGRIRHIDSEFASVLSQYASTHRRSAVPPSSVRHSSNAADRQGTAIRQMDGRTRTDADDDEVEDGQQRTKDISEQPLHVPSVSATTTTTAALVSSLLDRLSAFRHGRSSLHDERHKQQKLIENRARKALRTTAAVFP